MPATPMPDFAPTRWTLVLAAARHHHTPSDAPRAALEQLARAYWYPLYAFIRRRGHSPADAEDLTQSFFSHLLQHEALAAADRARGRFRAFLLACLKNFLINQHHRAHAAKREGNRNVPLSIDAETRYTHDTPADALTPERLFDRRWALQLLDAALDDVAAEYAARNDTALFLALKPTLTAPDDAPTYAAIAAARNQSENAVKTAAHRLRRRYRDALRTRIAATVDTPEQVNDEIRDLFAAL